MQEDEESGQLYQYRTKSTVWLSLVTGDWSSDVCSSDLATSQTPNGLLTDMGIVRKCFGNVPLKDVTMERKKVEEFEKSLCEDFG